MRVPLGGNPIYQVEVLRSDGESYCTVSELPGGTWTGTCEGFIFRGRCPHVDKVRASVDSEDVKLRGDQL